MASADWSWLPADLLNRIAECFLPTSDIDYYMDFRAVCKSWRTATKDPRNSLDPRYRPRQWVMIDDVDRSTATRLFVNTTTGRSLHKELLLLRNYYVTTVTSDGLLILIDRYSLKSVSVLNPFTGYIVHFIPLLSNEIVESAAIVYDSSPNLILGCNTYLYDGDEEYLFSESPHKVYVADPGSKFFAVYEDEDACPLVRLAVRGIYTNGEYGSMPPFPFAVAKRIFDLVKVFNTDPADTSDDEDDNRFFLVASAGELFIIFKLQKGMEIYRMDADRYTLEHVDNIGNRAIFLGAHCRCMSVNADKFPSIDANCIYYIKTFAVCNAIYMYNILSRREERICEDIYYSSAPYTIIQHLCDSLRGSIVMEF